MANSNREKCDKLIRAGIYYKYIKYKTKYLNL